MGRGLADRDAKATKLDWELMMSLSTIDRVPAPIESIPGLLSTTETASNVFKRFSARLLHTRSPND